jgi:predicted peptidase
VSSPSKIRGMDAGVQETKQQGFRPEKFTDSRGYTFPYRMLMPTRDPMQDKAGSREVDPERMPLVLMLHGWNERGDDNSAQLRNGVAELLGREAAALHFPCFYVVPQCSAKRSWVEVDMEAEHHVIPSEPSILCRQWWSLLTHFLPASPSIRSAST